MAQPHPAENDGYHYHLIVDGERMTMGLQNRYWANVAKQCIQNNRKHGRKPSGTITIVRCRQGEAPNGFKCQVTR